MRSDIKRRLIRGIGIEEGEESLDEVFWFAKHRVGRIHRTRRKKQEFIAGKLIFVYNSIELPE